MAKAGETADASVPAEHGAKEEAPSEAHPGDHAAARDHAEPTATTATAPTTTAEEAETAEKPPAAAPETVAEDLPAPVRTETLREMLALEEPPHRDRERAAHAHSHTHEPTAHGHHAHHAHSARHSDATSQPEPGETCEEMADFGARAAEAHELGAAQTLYKRVLACNPRYVPALVGHADAVWDTGDRARASLLYRAIVDNFPDDLYPDRVALRAAPTPSDE